MIVKIILACLIVTAVLFFVFDKLAFGLAAMLLGTFLYPFIDRPRVMLPETSKELLRHDIGL